MTMKTRAHESGSGVLGGIILALISLALLGWVLSSLSELYDRIAGVSQWLAAMAVVAVVGLLLALMLTGLRILWKYSRASRVARSRPAIAKHPEQAADQSLSAARRQLELVGDEIARQALGAELDRVQHDFTTRQYTIVVFGTTSAGKTSIINALLGGRVGATDPITGTTKGAAEHAYGVDGFDDGGLTLIDTPGLSEEGAAGAMREERARALASEADLLLFVVDQDLRDIEFKPMASLLGIGKRVLVVLNKRDLFPPEDVAAIRKRLGERLANLVRPEDVVVVAADPAPVALVDAGGGGGSGETHQPKPDVGTLADRIDAILRREGRHLLANTILLRARRVSQKARDVMDAARRENARAVVTRFQWTTAGVLFVNPVPGLGALAAAAINYQMVSEIASLFGVELGLGDAKKLARELGQVMMKLGVVSLATEILGKALKASVVGFVAGGTIEAVSGAYLTRVSGLAFIDYFAGNQDWGEGGVQGAIERHFDLEKKGEFVRAFIKEAAGRLVASSSETRDA